MTDIDDTIKALRNIEHKLSFIRVQLTALASVVRELAHTMQKEKDASETHESQET